jgi:hypothetical protein
MHNGHPSLIRRCGLTDEPDHLTGLRIELDSRATAPVDLKQDLMPASRHGQRDALTPPDPGNLVVVQDYPVASERIAPSFILTRQQ